MQTILNLIYAILLVLLSPWVLFRFIVQGKNQRGWGQKLLGLAPIRDSKSRCIWIHAVSVGEVNLLQPLVQQIRIRHPEIDLAISTTTETGFDLACKNYPDEIVFFCPSDFSWAVKNTIRRIKPDALLLTELELWPNLISSAQRFNVPVALINGRISEKSFRGYQRFSPFFSWLLKKLNVAIVQTGDYADRLESMGMPRNRIHVCGNLKFDALNHAQESKTNQIQELAEIGIDKFVFVAGSTQENEDRLAIELYSRLKPVHPKLRMILVPRHPDRAQRLAKFFQPLSIPFVFRSQLSEPINDDAVLVVDTIGELSDCWRIANLAYVGGSMGGRGGQNMIEPAALGIPVCFGPETENFKDIVHLLISKHAAKVVHDADELAKTIIQALGSDPSMSEMGARAQQLVQTQRGSTKRTLEILEPVIESNGSTKIRKLKDAA